MSMIKVHDPADGSLVGEVPHHAPHEVAAAIDRVCAAFPAWSRRLAKDRADVLRRWHDLVRAERRQFAELVCRENGKCLVEALGEIDYGLGFIEWYAEEARRAYGDTVPAHADDAAVLVTREPVGPVAAITPWNFPFMMITRKVAPALAAGCTIVLKPAEETPLTAYRLLELARRAGIPEGVFELVTGDPPAIGAAMTGDPRIRKISFTGSTDVGRLLARQGSGTLKKLTMELGGNAPFIVYPDADLEAAAAGLVAAKLRNAGQVCISPNRIYVHESIHDDLVARVARRVDAIPVDRGLREDFCVGPLINRAAVEKVQGLVDDARRQGARIVMGGGLHAKGGLFYAPTILAGVTDEMAMRSTEIFGPVFPFYRFASEDEVVRRANDTEYGLVAYAYTRDLGRAFRTSRDIEAGMVILNSGAVGTASVPFGGVKQSGFGREGSYHGLHEYLQLKYTLMAGLGA
jgi:succinate-semialdehyde dehydrogenase/glutarate-semialdehyde dehydrogenase